MPLSRPAPRCLAALLACAVMLTTAPATAAGQTELVANGGFETDADADGRPDGWTVLTIGGAPYARTTPVARTGSHSMSMTGGATTVLFSPAFHVEPGTLLTLSLYARSVQEVAALSIDIDCYDADGRFVASGGDFDVILIEKTLQRPQVWQHWTDSFHLEVPAGTSYSECALRLQLNAIRPGGMSAVLVDDVSVTMG